MKWVTEDEISVCPHIGCDWLARLRRTWFEATQCDTQEKHSPTLARET